MDKKQVEADNQLIERLGGPAAIAEMLGDTSPGGVQRVTNWRTRGIPSAVKIAYPRIFLRELMRAGGRK